MKDWIVNIIDQLGYWGLALMMFLENIFPPIPSELIMPLGGFVASQGKLSLPLVILAGTIGSVVGQLPLYYLGHFLGKARLMRLADKYGKWLTVSGADIDKASKWFARRGSAAVLIGRLVPGVRSLVSIPAGICGMGLPKFLLFSALGMGVWAGALAFAGHLLGQNYEKVEKYMGPVSKIVLALIVVGFIVWVWRRKHNQSREQPAETPPDADVTDECAT
jgi:membrane protein DedA with SNARE-associated domain